MPAGVVDEVAHDLRELPPVADDPHVRGLDPGDDPARRPQPLRLGDLVEVDVLEPRPQAALVGAGEQQQRVDQPTQPRGLAAQGGDRVAVGGRSGLSRASSSRPVAIVASGLRSSWLASATNRRCTAWPACSRASISFIVSASLPTSSRAGGTGTRTDGSRVVATRARMASTGRRARPAAR